MKQISDEMWLQQIIPILNMLARKNHPNKNDNSIFWMSTHPEHIRDYYDCFYCFICNKLVPKLYEWDGELKIDTVIPSIRRHGYQHLKEKNLLPFL